MAGMAGGKVLSFWVEKSLLFPKIKIKFSPCHFSRPLSSWEGCCCHLPPPSSLSLSSHPVFNFSSRNPIASLLPLHLSPHPISDDARPPLFPEIFFLKMNATATFCILLSCLSFSCCTFFKVRLRQMACCTKSKITGKDTYALFRT